ncbi:hypothetical protein SAMN05880582_1011053 [Rhizobium sp. RU20A]|nr:hypothetical protein SAMN05880582_1011053 [Rhizobium sp. RU20A]
MISLKLLQPSSVAADIYIGCVGYELRSSEALRTYNLSISSREKLLLDYDCGDRLSYPRNIEFVRGIDCELFKNTMELIKAIEYRIVGGPKKCVMLDVTSLDRRVMAKVLESLFDLRAYISNIEIIYYPQTFVEPTAVLEQVLTFAPVTSRFVGEASYSRDALSLIVGAGYEYGRIVGAIDVLEPERVYCFHPVGTDSRFEEAIYKNNLGFSFLDNPDFLLPYDLLTPYELYQSLRSLIEVELRERDVLLLPLGPKIFAAISIVIALQLSPSVMVWRHSTTSHSKPSTNLDAVADGKRIDFSFSFSEPAN